MKSIHHYSFSIRGGDEKSNETVNTALQICNAGTAQVLKLFSYVPGSGGLHVPDMLSQRADYPDKPLQAGKEQTIMGMPY